VKKLAVLSAILAVPLLAAGCGGGGDDNLTKSEFVAQGNAICKKGNQQLNAAGKALGKHPTKAQFTSFTTDTLIPSIESQASQIRALKEPSADEDQVNAILDEVDAAVAKLKANPALITTNADPFAKANKMANAYGLTVCGSG
jgi:hypothetical protein